MGEAEGEAEGRSWMGAGRGGPWREGGPGPEGEDSDIRENGVLKRIHRHTFTATALNMNWSRNRVHFIRCHVLEVTLGGMVCVFEELIV